jgi:hypothetical protein
MRNRIVPVICALAGMAMLAWGCRPQTTAAPNATGVAQDPRVDRAPHAASLQPIDLSDPAHPHPLDPAVTLTAARNEWVSFAVQIGGVGSDPFSLRLNPVRAQGAGTILPASCFSAYRVLPVPVDMDRAAYVRHTGLSVATRTVPRVLVPQTIDAAGSITMAGNFGPGPTPASSSIPPIVWIDVHVSELLAAGDYGGSLDLLQRGSAQPIASVPLHVAVQDFNLPHERHLQMVGRLSWERLEKLFPDRFETITPRWLNRRESRYAQTLKILDDLVAQAQANRAAVIIPALRPVTKWPAGGQPEVDWRDFDSIVRPWFSGDAFVDRVGLRYWPLPAAEMLDRYDRRSQLEYWTQASAHFDQNHWLDLSAVSLDTPVPGRVDAADRIDLSAQAAGILRTNPRVRVLLPIDDDQLQVAAHPASAGGPDPSNQIDPANTGRLLTPSAALISAPPARPWAADAAKPRHWLRADLPGLVPYLGAGGGERDVRVWAWLAFLRHVTTYGNTDPPNDDNAVLWDDVLPASTQREQAADPNELTWFYPGAWFGVDRPVATLQLKWLRRAQQDYEYLLLARQRGEVINALQMARLVTKPVELQPGQTPDPVYSLLSGTSDPHVWDAARRLLTETILLRPPGETPDAGRQQELYLRTMEWAAPQEHPLLLGRSTEWAWSTSDPAATADARSAGGTWVDLRLGLDIYNASETTPDESRLQWTRVPQGWEIHPQELDVPRLRTYHVLRATLAQRFNLDRVSAAARQPMQLQFVDGFRKVASPLKLVLPVVASDRREGRLSIDAALDDWSSEDSIQDGPMVRMLDRPALQSQLLQSAATPAHVYTSWARENFYVAFALQGLITGEGRVGRNFIDYQQRRAWGEDLCEILIQPIYANNNLGPVLHVVCKPNGAVTLERKADPRAASAGGAVYWQPIESAAAGLRYASAAPAGQWRGELAIPWTLIVGPTGETPTLLRFNFSQHRAATGESASWAGPVDFGRDDALMGLIYLRSPDARGAENVVQGQQ